MAFEPSGRGDPGRILGPPIPDRRPVGRVDAPMAADVTRPRASLTAVGSPGSGTETIRAGPRVDQPRPQLVGPPVPAGDEPGGVADPTQPGGQRAIPGPGGP